MRKPYITAFTILSIAACSIFTLSQSGGTFVIQRSAIVAGGDRSSGGTFTLDGTIGESIAGTTSSGGIFQLGGGFWGGGTAAAAANVTISGRVLTSDGLTGLRNAGVSLTDPTGVVRTITTSSFGFYSFDNVATGTTYTIRILSRRFRFQSRVVQVGGDLTNVDFVGLE